MNYTHVHIRAPMPCVQASPSVRSAITTTAITSMFAISFRRSIFSHIACSALIRSFPKGNFLCTFSTSDVSNNIALIKKHVFKIL